MRRSVFLVGLFLSVVAVAGAGWLYWQNRPATYEARGRIAGFNDVGRRVYVEHERIPGYMPAMTMPFTLADTSLLAGFETGDAVRFTLETGGAQARITSITGLPDSAVARHPAGTPVAADTSRIEGRGPALGEQLPDVRLVDQDGRAFALRDERGTALAVTFVYTRCPLPDQCPLMSRNFQELQPRFRNAFGDSARLLSVSFDPEYDTPRVLREYASRYTDRTDNWTFATGDPSAIRRLTSFFRIYTHRDDDQVVHNLTTAVVGPNGRVREVWRGNDWTPDEVLRSVRRALARADGPS